MYKNVLQSASHEIHTYLNGILGYISLLEYTSLDEHQIKQVNKIHQSGENLLALIDDTILFNTYCNHPLEVAKNKCELDTIFAEVKNNMMAFAESKGKVLHWLQKVPAGMFLDSDESRIKLVLSRVLKFFILMSDYPEVKFILEHSPNHHLMFSLQTPVQIVPFDKIQLVFEKISPTDIPDVRKKDCSGFELAIAKKIIESLNGKISLFVNDKGTLLEGYF